MSESASAEAMCTDTFETRTAACVVTNGYKEDVVVDCVPCAMAMRILDTLLDSPAVGSRSPEEEESEIYCRCMAGVGEESMYVKMSLVAVSSHAPEYLLYWPSVPVSRNSGSTDEPGGGSNMKPSESCTRIWSPRHVS
jgi:hypothetical protein